MEGSLILGISPDRRGFLPKYLLALTPLILLLISLIVTAAIRGFVAGIPMSIPTPMGNLAQGMGDMVETLILLASPVGIFALVAAIGFSAGIREVWSGSALALGLAGLGASLMVTFLPDPSLSRTLDFLYWIAYLMPLASIAATTLVIAWTEKFRSTIRYEVTTGGLIMRGGIWRKQENLIPLPQIGKLVLEQGPLERLLHTGTIIPVQSSGTGQKDHSIAGAGLAKAVQRGSRSPLDCLYKIRDPEKVMPILQQLISRPAERGEEQVPPKKISGKP
jgi:membrane protein YdbS with pleckstrin-like domain